MSRKRNIVKIKTGYVHSMPYFRLMAKETQIFSGYLIWVWYDLISVQWSNNTLIKRGCTLIKQWLLVNSRFFVGFLLPCNLFGLLILRQSVLFYYFFNCTFAYILKKREFLENWAGVIIHEFLLEVQRLDFMRADPIASRKWSRTFTPQLIWITLGLYFNLWSGLALPMSASLLVFILLSSPGLGVCQLLRVKFAYSYSPL